MMVLLCTGCAGFFTPEERFSAGTSVDAGVVHSFLNGFGQHRATRLSRFFTDDARVEITGLGIVAQGGDALADFFGYGLAVKSRLALVELRIVHDSVFCRLKEENELTGRLKLEPLIYDALFILEGRRIKRLLISPEPVSRSLLMAKGIAFFNWLRRNAPGALNELMPDGRFRFTPDNGRLLIELISRWQSQN
ncbi:MAG: hypothetical protein ACP5PK_02110 [candidate division WOR-3 bacterium]|jgi:hypothetical protein